MRIQRGIGGCAGLHRCKGDVPGRVMGWQTREVSMSAGAPWSSSVQ